MFSGWRESRRRAREAKLARSASALAPPAAPPAAEAETSRGLGIRGRELELEQLLALSSPVVLVTGPPGVGKSGLLEASGVRFASDPVICATVSPVELEFRSGTLQASLLGALGMALAAHESSEPLAARWGRIFKDALDRAADTTAQDMIRGATAVMNGFVRARLGDAAGQALDTFETSLLTAVDEQLARRIEADADPGAMRAFCTLAEQVQILAGGPVVLTLDRGERLSDADFRMLLDMIEMLPASVHVHVGHTRAKPEDEDRLTQLRVAAAATHRSSVLTVVDLNGLARDVVAGWMSDLGLEPDRQVSGVDEVIRVTAGYPLHVDLALRAIQRGASLEQLTGDEALSSMIDQNYRVLDAEDQRVLMLVASFGDPPDVDIVLEVLGIDEQAWAVRQQRLIAARFLVSQVAETAWFHELGRRLLWDRVLSPTQRTAAAGTVVRVLLAHVASADRVRLSYCIDLARLAEHTPTTFASHAGATAVLALGAGHLAVAGALEELTDEKNPVAFIGDVVSHARRRFGPVVDDLYDSAEQLGYRKLAFISEDEQNQVLGVSWASREARFLGVGRIFAECGRVPIKGIARAVLNGLLIPHCDPFHLASLGSGHSDLTRLSRELEERQHDREENFVTTHDRPGILLRPILGSLEFAGAISFNDAASRDRALEALTGPGAPPRLYGEAWNVEEIYPWPQAEPIPARRFAAAAELLTSQNFHHGFSVPNVPDLRPVSSLNEEMELVVRTWRTLAKLSDGLERAVLDLTRPRGIGFFTAGSGVISGEILGRAEAVDLGSLEGLAFGLAARKALDRGLGLGPDERITRMFYRSDGRPRNPVPELIKQTHKDLKDFNDAQRVGLRINAAMDVDSLTSAILASLNRRQADAQAMLEADLFPDPGRPLGSELHILAVPPPGITHYPDTWDSRMIMAKRKVDAPNSVTLRIVGDLSAEEAPWEHLDREFGIKVIGGDAETTGVLSSLDDGLADLLSYDSLSLDLGN